jgi:RNA polymerase sigma-70 factor (ECF subfamily)
LPLAAAGGADAFEADDQTEPDDDGPSEAALELLSPLPPRYRQVLELRFLEGYSIQETARQMGTTTGNAKVLQHRALKKAAAVQEEAACGRDGTPR